MRPYYGQDGKYYDGRVETTTQLTGRNVEKVYTHNAVAITTTGTNTVNIDLSKYRSFQIVAFSSLNQPVDIFANSAVTAIWDGAAWDTANARKMTIATGQSANRYFLNTKMPWLDRALDTLTIAVSCSVAPTTGSVTIYVLGVPN